MDSKGIVSRRQVAELSALVADAENAEKSPHSTGTGSGELTEEQKAELTSKRRSAGQRVDKLVWNNKKDRVIDGRVLPHRTTLAVTGYSHLPAERTLDYSDWIIVDQPDDHTQVEARLSVHSDVTRFTGESGYNHTIGGEPVWTISIRLNNPDLDVATEPEELFTLTWGDTVAYRGDVLVGVDSPHWDDLDQLLADVEKHFELPQQLAAS